MTLMNLLDPVAFKWELLCLQLGVPLSDLKNIESNPMKFSGAPKTFLQDGLYIWLQQEPKQHTISVLCQALKEAVMDEEVLSKEIERKLKSRKGMAKI